MAGITLKKERHIHLHGRTVPVTVVQERRGSYRAGVGRRGLILRLPRGMSTQQQEHAWNWFTDWAKQALGEKAALLDSLALKEYRNGQVLQVGQRRYTLLFEERPQITCTAKLRADGCIFLRVQDSLEPLERQKIIQTLLSRVVAQDFMPHIIRRVNELNARYFQKQVKAVKLSYLHSKWGSCSTLGNINLSTRLLFAPENVIDYVIVHELAHLVVMNHSPQFWKAVEQAMPDYKRCEEWLRTHGSVCNF